MNRQEAIEILEEVKNLDDSIYQYISAYNEALDMAIEALKQEPCDDVISRSDILDAIGHDTTYTSNDLQKIIKNLPYTSPTKTGYWLSYIERDGETVGWVCSSCRRVKSTTYDRTEYCPVCGAKMDYGVGIFFNNKKGK